MNSNYYVVIMAGGVGVRFWPVSKTERPKQFIDILGTGRTLIQQTIERFADFCPVENIYVVTNAIYKELVTEQLPMLSDGQILCEPYRKNTAPCIAYANYKIRSKNPDATVVVAPSDHVVQNQDVFLSVISQAAEAATKNHCLLTLGIRPSYPNTGYGYIQFDDENTCQNAPMIKKVKVFTEKPGYEMAKSFVESGEFLWNAGIFIWSLKAIMEAFKEYLPEMDELFSAYAPMLNTPMENEGVEKMYVGCKSISIDYGIMEKAKNVYVLAADFGWSDVGTWNSLYEVRAKNEDGNAVVGNNVMTYESRRCIIHVPENKLVVLQGMEDYIVVENDDILLVCKRTEEQQIRQFVNDVNLNKGEMYI